MFFLARQSSAAIRSRTFVVGGRIALERLVLVAPASEQFRSNQFRNLFRHRIAWFRRQLPMGQRADDLHLAFCRNLPVTVQSCQRFVMPHILAPCLELLRRELESVGELR